MDREESIIAVNNEIFCHQQLLLMSIPPFVLSIITKDSKEHVGGSFFLKLTKILGYAIPGITASQIVILLKLLRIYYQLKRDETSYIDGSFDEFSKNIPVANVFTLKPITLIGKKGSRTY